MSTFLAAALILALFIANVFMMIACDRWVERIANTIITGVERGVSLPLAHRTRLLQVNLLTTTSGVLAAEAGVGIGWIVLGRNAPTDDLMWVCYLFAFMGLLAVFAWLVTMPLNFRHLSGMLEQGDVS